MKQKRDSHRGRESVERQREKDREGEINNKTTDENNHNNWTSEYRQDLQNQQLILQREQGEKKKNNRQQKETRYPEVFDTTISRSTCEDKNWRDHESQWAQQ